MNRLLSLTAGSVVIVLVAGAALAGPNDDATVGMFLVKASDYANQGCAYPPADCEDEELVVSGKLSTPYYAYVCVFNGSSETGVAGVELGIDYNGGSGSGVDVFSWVKCVDLAFAEPAWPAPGSGGSFTWSYTNNCQNDQPGGLGTGVTAVVGYFYMSAYSDDTLEIGPRPGSGALAVVDCDIVQDSIPEKQRGSLGFSENGSVEGKPGCKRNVFQPTSWGGLKDTYSN